MKCRKEVPAKSQDGAGPISRLVSLKVRAFSLIRLASEPFLSHCAIVLTAWGLSNPQASWNTDLGFRGLSHGQLAELSKSNVVRAQF